MSRIAYLNGQWVPESELKISAWDLATMQGASCFEMLRSFRHQHFKLNEHLERLRRSCELLHIPLPLDFENLESICHDVTARNPMPESEEHRLLIVVNAGAARIYREIEGAIQHSYFYVATFPLRYTVQGFSKYFLEGVQCVTSRIHQVGWRSIPPQAKHRSRLHFHLAQQQAPAGTWPILVANGFHGIVPVEAPGANLVVVEYGAVRTLEALALPGISMATVKALTGATAYEVNPSLRTVGRAQELWLTGTPFTMIPVVSLDGQPIGNGKIGPVYKETLAKWKDLVQCDFEQQIIEWDRQKVWTPDAQRLSHASKN